MLGRAVGDAFERAGRSVVRLTREQLDVTSSDEVHRVMRKLRPRVVVQCAAYTRVDDAEKEENLAFAVNATAVHDVAVACKEVGARLVYPSTDYVFDGTSREPYSTNAATNPISAYGRSKLAGEHAAEAAGDFLVIRTSWLYGPGGKNFVRTVSQRAKAGLPLSIVDDQYGSPTWTIDLADRMVALISANAETGIFHMTAAGSTNWYEYAVEIARLMELNAGITATSSNAYKTAAARPAWSVLDCTRADEVIGPAPEWRDTLRRAIDRQAY